MWSAILCADWSKQPTKREVYAAWPAERRVSRLLPPAGGWTVALVLAAAEGLRALAGSVLVGFDAPIGVPESFLRAVGGANFPAWLRSIAGNERFFEPLPNPGRWSVKRPFVRIPAGEGSRRAFEKRLRRRGFETLRKIDALAHAKPAFIASGIPGSVGSATSDIWRGLAAALRAKATGPALWPFDGRLAELAAGRRLVVGEIYPRLAYALAAAPNVAKDLHPIAVAKSRPALRAVFLERVSAWAGRAGVAIDDLGPARDSEDAFDACVTAAALLRCQLEGTPLSDPTLEDPVAEGGILGSGGVRLTLREQAFRAEPGAASPSPQQRGLFGPPPTALYRCPIPGCTREFKGARGGWDGHVGSRAQHPSWHPELKKQADRIEQFRVEFAKFFR